MKTRLDRYAQIEDNDTAYERGRKLNHDRRE